MEKRFCSFFVLVSLSLFCVSFVHAANKIKGVEVTINQEERNASQPHPIYDFSLTEELGVIPDTPDANLKKPDPNSPNLAEELERWGAQSLENTLARFRERGSALAQILWETTKSGQYIWYRGEVKPWDPEGFYPGGLERISLVLPEGDVPVQEILATSMPAIKGSLRGIRAVSLYPAGTEVIRWSEFESLVFRSGVKLVPVYYVLLAFNRNFDPKRVTGIKFGSEFMPMVVSVANGQNP